MLRHGLLEGGEAAGPQIDGPDPILGEDFEVELSFDSDGVVIDYPGIATRIHPQSVRA